MAGDERRREAAGSAETRWILLIHQIPPKPAYLRVKIGRHLARIGAVAIKNSVYALPLNDETHEDFQWVLPRSSKRATGRCWRPASSRASPTSR